MSEEQKLMSDEGLDRLLALATTPAVNPDFQQRMMAKINLGTTNNLVAFPQKHRAKSWLVGLPLAASLALGLWLGASGSTINLLPTSATEVATTDVGDGSGFDDIVSVIEGKTS